MANTPIDTTTSEKIVTYVRDLDMAITFGWYRIAKDVLTHLIESIDVMNREVDHFEYYHV